MARRVTRVSRGIKLPVEQEPVLPPPSVRDQVVGMYEGPFGWPEGVVLDPRIAVEPPVETLDVPTRDPRLLQPQEIATRRKRRRRY